MTLPLSIASVLVMTVLLTSTATLIGSARADDAPWTPWTNDGLCNYCGDFTYQVIDGRPVASSYAPGVGYPNE